MLRSDGRPAPTCARSPSASAVAGICPIPPLIPPLYPAAACQRRRTTSTAGGAPSRRRQASPGRSAGAWSHAPPRTRRRGRRAGTITIPVRPAGPRQVLRRRRPRGCPRLPVPSRELLLWTAPSTSSREAAEGRVRVYDRGERRASAPMPASSGYRRHGAGSTRPTAATSPSTTNIGAAKRWVRRHTSSLASVQGVRMPTK